MERVYLSNAVLDEMRGQVPSSLVGRGPRPMPARLFMRLLDGGYAGLDKGEPYLTRDGREIGIEEFVRHHGVRPEVAAQAEAVGDMDIHDLPLPRRRITSTSATPSAIMTS